MPDPDRVCTSHIERQNLTIRMSMRRLTRLTNGFSKKWENLKAAYALHFAHYNFCRIHSSIKCTPAMEAGDYKARLGVERLANRVSQRADESALSVFNPLRIKSYRVNSSSSSTISSSGTFAARA
jgi:hypothetical protein